MIQNFWEMVFPKPKLYGGTLFVCLATFLFALISIWIPEQNKELFVWIIFFIPMLWMLWFCCGFFICEKGITKKLFLLWIIINAVIFAFIISFSSFDHWKHSRDADVVIVTIYFPIIIPIILFLGVLPETVGDIVSNNLNLLTKLIGGSDQAELFVICVAINGLAVLELFGLIGFRQILFRIWKKENKASVGCVPRTDTTKQK